MFALLSTLTWLATVVGDAPPDADGAKALEAMYAAYFSTKAIETGVISVTPDGASYVVAWDLQKAAQLAKIPDSVFKMEPFSYRLTPAAGGVWTLDADTFPKIEFDVSSAQPPAHYAFTLDGFGLQGRYDPAKEPFLTSKLTIDKFDNQVVGQGDSAAPLSATSYTGLTLDAQSRTAAAGGVDFSFTQHIASVSQSVKAEATPAGFGVEIATGQANGEGAATGVKAQEIGALWKYLVARAEASQKPTGVAPLLTAALPLWTRLEAKGDNADMKVDTQLGSAEAKTIGARIAMSGVADPGRIDIGVDFDAFSLSSPLAPPWASKLMPAAAHVAFAISDKGVSQAARVMLSDPGFGAGTPSKATQDAATAAIVGGDPRLIFETNSLNTPVVALTFGGDLAINTEAPSGHFHVTADSLDRLMAVASEIAASDPSAQDGLLALTFVKGLAKTGPDGRMTWDIDLAGKEVVVNGTPMPNR